MHDDDRLLDMLSMAHEKATTTGAELSEVSFANGVAGDDAALDQGHSRMAAERFGAPSGIGAAGAAVA